MRAYTHQYAGIRSLSSLLGNRNFKGTCRYLIPNAQFQISNIVNWVAVLTKSILRNPCWGADSRSESKKIRPHLRKSKVYYHVQRASHQFVSWARRIQSTFSGLISQKFIPFLSYHLCLALLSDFFLFRISSQNFSFAPCALQDPPIPCLISS
jgi:hypothetical protein